MTCWKAPFLKNGELDPKTGVDHQKGGHPSDSMNCWMFTAGCSLLDVHQKSSDICQATACPSTDVALSSPPTLNPSRHSLKGAADGEGR